MPTDWNRPLSWLLLALAAVPGYARAQARLTVDRVFSDHMVWQRDRPIAVTGTSLPGLDVQVRFGRHRVSVTTGPDSGWRVVLPPLKASKQPQDLLVGAGGDSLRLRDILVGDVWVCLGQSNMEWPMAREAHYGEALAQAVQPLIRLYNPAYAGKHVFGTPFTDSIVRRLQPGGFLQGGWQRSDSGSMPSMSAVGWYFARSVVASEGIPVGLVNLSVGGAPLEAMTDPGQMASHPAFARKLQGVWLDNEALPVWVRERGRQNVGGLPGVPADAMGPAHPFRPGFLYEAAVRPLQALPVRGLLCYQGESNAQERARVDEYPELFVRMVEGCRRGWGDARLPVYFVQLSSIDTLRYRGQLWPDFRDMQRRIPAMLPHSGMAVSSDHGHPHDVHPTEKRATGQRLARQALSDTYGRRVVPSGPLPRSATFRRGRVVVRFRHGGGLQTADGAVLRGFTLDGGVPVRATIAGRRVRVEVPLRPLHIHYGWKPFTDANLVNGEGLPASTFKIDVR
jgi:sialate O-acetylesterase